MPDSQYKTTKRILPETLQAQFYYALQTINLSNDMDLRKEIFFNSTGVEKYQPTKRDFKKYGIASGYVFSFCSMQNVLSISKDFAKYCRENNITKANKITPSIALGFLEKKASEGASVRTLLAYKSALIKIDTAIKNAFNCKGFCRTENNIKNFVIGKPETIERRLTNNQVEQILQQKSKFSFCFALSFVLMLIGLIHTRSHSYRHTTGFFHNQYLRFVYTPCLRSNGRGIPR